MNILNTNNVITIESAGAICNFNRCGTEVDPIPVVVAVIFVVDTLVTPVPTFALLKHVEC